MDKYDSILIPKPALFSFDECRWFLDRNYDDCLHSIRDASIIKAISCGSEVVLVQIRDAGAFLEAAFLAGNPTVENKANVAAFIREWFDMDRDIQPFYDLLKSDARFSYMADDFKGLRLISISDLFEAICWSIIGQQINLSFAYRIKRRLIERYGTCMVFENEPYYTFPAPEILAAASIAELQSMQFSERKAQYVTGIASAFASGSLSKQMLLELPDFESRKKALISHKGIGIWTANYALMKSLREPGGIPHGDVGLLNALLNHNIIRDRQDQPQIDALFSQYAGWESYLVFYLWRSLAVKALY